MDRNALVGLHNQYYQLFTKTLILICTETLLKGITEAHIQSCVSERARQCNKYNVYGAKPSLVPRP